MDCVICRRFRIHRVESFLNDNISSKFQQIFLSLNNKLIKRKNEKYMIDVADGIFAFALSSFRFQN